MKDLHDITAAVVDYGSFISLADKLSETYKKVYYYSPFEDEFECVKKCAIADGLGKVERLDDYMNPAVFNTIDLWIFPDIAYGGFQKYLRSVGKLVWGSMGADEFELYRTKFIELLQRMELPIVKSVKLRGLTALSNYLKTVKDKWIKINRFRGDMETWHHIDYEHSQTELMRLYVQFGGLCEYPVFIVQDGIKSDLEIGYDGWTVDGQFPDASFQGYEAKNELYLGSLLKSEKLPPQIKLVNRELSPILKEYGYRNFIATEIRVREKTPYFIDPTMRMPGQTGEQLLETCDNLAEVIAKGAAGELVSPKFNCQFSAEATMHYTAECEGWRVLRIPDEIKRWFKLYHYCKADGLYHFPPHNNDELGVVLGTGNTIESAINDLKKHFDSLKDEPVAIEFEGFAELLADVKKATQQGVKFTTQPIPKPAMVIDK